MRQNIVWSLTRRATVAVSVMLFTTSGACAFTYDEVYPDLRSLYVTAQNSTLHLFHNTPYTGMGGGVPLNVRWGAMTPGQSLRLRVLLPPGADSAGFALNTNNFTAAVGVCDDGVSDCPVKLGGQSPVVWPLNYVPGQSNPKQLITDANGKYVEIVIRDPDYPFTVFDMHLTVNIADNTLYEQWRTTVLPTLSILALPPVPDPVIPPTDGTSTAPSTPSGLTASVTSDTAIRLSWNAVGGATMYRIMQENGANHEISATTKDFDYLPASVQQCFTVVACNANFACSAASQRVCATPGAPAEVESLSATADGSYDAFNLHVAPEQQASFVNKAGNYFIHATLPGGTVYSLSSSGWGSGKRNYFDADQTLTAQQITLFSNSDLTPFFSQVAGAVFQAGYSVAGGSPNASDVYTLASALPAVTAEQVADANTLRVTFTGSAAKAYWQLLAAGTASCPTAAQVRQNGSVLSASTDLPLVSLLAETGYTACLAVEDANGILGSSAATAVPLTGILTLAANSPQGAMLAAQSNGNGLLFWRVRPVGETASATAATIKATGRVVPLIANQPSRIVVDGLTANATNKVDVLMEASGVDTAVQTVSVAAGTDSRFVWNPNADGIMQATITPSGFAAGTPGQYYVYVVPPNTGNTLIFARDNNGSAGVYPGSFQQEATLQPYYTGTAMESTKNLILLPSSLEAHPDFAGVQVYAGYRMGTSATDAVFWSYLHTFGQP